LLLAFLAGCESVQPRPGFRQIQRQTVIQITETIVEADAPPGMARAGRLAQGGGQ